MDAVLELKGLTCFPSNSYYRTGNIYGRSEAMKRYIGTCLPHAGRYMQSRTGAVTQVSILPQSFFLPRGTRAFTVFSLCSANCNEKIAAPRRTRVTNATKICRTSLVARYAAPPCVTRYAATYIASTVHFLNPNLQTWALCCTHHFKIGKPIKGEVKAKIKISPVVVFGVLSRMVVVRGS